VVEPFIWDGSTFLPLRAIADALGLDVAWVEDTSTVVLTSPAVVMPALVIPIDPVFPPVEVVE